MEYLAHYDKKTNEKQLLRDHLVAVGNACKSKVSPLVSFENINNEMIKEIAYIVGTFHDIGKYTSYFQNYIRSNRRTDNSEHAHISALYIYIALKNRLVINEIEDKKIILLISYLCARFHHGSLTIEIRHSDKFAEKSMWKNLNVQWKNLLQYKHEIIMDFKDLLGEIITLEQLNDIQKNLEKLQNIESIVKDDKLIKTAHEIKTGKIKKSKWFYFFIYLFSILIDTDKMDSASIITEDVKGISPNKVNQYLETKQKGHNLVDKRERARKTILKSIENLNEEQVKEIKFFTLTAPTGIGKTLSSLQAALTLQKKISDIEGYIPRIITAIPFINIIEQNKQEYKNVIGNDGKIVVHHRLSDFSKIKSANENMPIEKKLMEVEAWEGDFVLTTFVQIFQSIFTGKNKLLKKFHKLAGSIVILDEAQAIDEKYMPIVGAVLIEISKYLGTRFILMTATQPKIIDFGKLLLKENNIRTISLLPDYKNYFKELTRTKLIPILNKNLDLNEFVDLFFDKWKQEESALIVVNTIKRSIEVFDEIRKRLIDREIDVEIDYLSTNIVPFKRREVIDSVKEKLKKRPVILVSTQTIEAGVDLDFDMAFRDFAPLGSIIQTAGRVNREGKKGNHKPVYIVKISKDTDYVYNLMIRNDTRNLIFKEEKILEEDYEEFSDKYYSEALKRGVSDDSLEIWEDGILKLKFDKIEKFKLIDTDDVEDVFVELNDYASKISNIYEKVFKGEMLEKELIKEIISDEKNLDKYTNELDHFQRKSLLKLISSKLSDYIIQVRVQRLRENIPMKFSDRGEAYTELYWIPKLQLKDYYDIKAGFKADNIEAFIF